MPLEKRVKEIHETFSKKLDKAMEFAGIVGNEEYELANKHLFIRNVLINHTPKSEIFRRIMPHLLMAKREIKEEMKKAYLSEKGEKASKEELQMAFERYIQNECARGSVHEQKIAARGGRTLYQVSKKDIDEILKHV